MSKALHPLLCRECAKHGVAIPAQPCSHSKSIKLSKSQKAEIQKITDLCCCVNAFEGYFMAYPKGAGDKVYWRQRKAMTDTILDTAWTVVLEGVPLKTLDKALVAGGWDDNYFVIVDGNLKIECK